MSKRTKNIRSTKSSSVNLGIWPILSAILILTFSGCTGLFLDPPSGSVDDTTSPGVVDADTGTLSISLGGELGASTMQPDIDMDVADYEIVGSGPNSESFQQTSANGALTVENVVPGTWAITVNARNAQSEVIGSGSASTNVEAGKTAPVNVVVAPLQGDGTLRITVTWPDADVATPSVAGQVDPSWGDPIDLDFTVDGSGHATAADLQIPGGYYTLSVQILDGSEVAAGAVDVARIVKDGLTSGNVGFTSVKKSGGSTTINIDPDMDDPLTVQLSGASAEIDFGQSMTVTASVAESGVTPTYQWYLDGASVGSGSSYTVPSDLPEDFYRLDVIATSGDGSRTGSATHEFHVAPIDEPIIVQDTQFTLYWDVPTGTATIASYNIYYRDHGTGSWNFLNSVTASANPSYTVTSTMLPYGVYEFAVTSVSTDGLESEIHSSLDDNADPAGGWFLDWRAP